MENKWKTLKGMWKQICQVRGLSGAAFNPETHTISLGPEGEAFLQHPKHKEFVGKSIKNYDKIGFICGDDAATGGFVGHTGKPIGGLRTSMYNVDDLQHDDDTPKADEKVKVIAETQTLGLGPTPPMSTPSTRESASNDGHTIPLHATPSSVGRPSSLGSARGRKRRGKDIDDPIASGFKDLCRTIGKLTEAIVIAKGNNDEAL